MLRFHARTLFAWTCLSFLVGPAGAQDARIPASTPLPPGAPAVYRLSLDEAQRLALANNTGIALGQLSVREKAIATDAARRDYFPKLLANFNYFHFNSDLGKVVTFRTGLRGILPPGTRTVASVVANQDSTVTAVTLAQPITKLIAVNAAVQLARADTQIAQAQLDKGTKDLLSGVAQAFQGLYGAQRIESALTLQVQVAERFVGAGSAPEIRIALIEAQQALVQVRSQVADLTEQLNNLLNLPPCTRFELVEPLPPDAPVCSADQAAQFALRCNPQVQEAMAGVDKAHAGLKVARSEFLPDVNVFGQYFDQTAAPIIQQNIGALGVSASYTFVDWGKRRRVRDQRETQVALASTNVRATIEKVRLEAAQAFVAYDQARQSFNLANDMAQARKDAEAGARGPEALGAATAATARAELELIQAEITYRVAHARLLGLIGNP